MIWVTNNFHFLKTSCNDVFQISNVSNETRISAECYLRGINKWPDKWQKVIENNGKFTIDCNSFIVRLFMDKLYFINMEIVYDSPQEFSCFSSKRNIQYNRYHLQWYSWETGQFFALIQSCCYGYGIFFILLIKCMKNPNVHLAYFHHLF